MDSDSSLWKSQADDLHSKLENLEQLLTKFEIESSIDEFPTNDFIDRNLLNQFSKHRKRSSVDSVSALLQSDPGLNINLKDIAADARKKAAIQPIQEVDSRTPPLQVEEVIANNLIETEKTRSERGRVENNEYEKVLMEEYKKCEAKLMIKNEKIALLNKENELKINENIDLKLKNKELHTKLEEKDQKIKKLEEIISLNSKELKTSNEELIKSFESEIDMKTIEIETLKQKISSLVSSSSITQKDWQNEIDMLRNKNKKLLIKNTKLQEEIEFLKKNELVTNKHKAAVEIAKKMNKRYKAKNLENLSREDLIVLYLDSEERLRLREQEIAEYKQLIDGDRLSEEQDEDYS
ncbi:unnamed protein product [Blepharisma stoltei]|uniref:Uncharacterized protein n=1 Tax=Blepharisma stoltei TaxID=1481888 RepID=A0AAU9JHT1_9CILI|nr:unnamed protein product [Blepharisma stoltei]